MAAFLCCFCAAQTESPQVDHQSARVNELRQQEAQYTFSEPESSVPEDSLQTNTAWQFIKLILVLILVIACIYAVVWFLKKTTNPAFAPDPYLKKVASVNLAPGKSVYIVSTPTQAFMVGSSDSSVNLIGEITDKELIDEMNLHNEKQPTGKVKDFASMLSAFMPNKNKTATGSDSVFDQHFSTAAEETREIIRQRREKMQEAALSKQSSSGEKK